MTQRSWLGVAISVALLGSVGVGWAEEAGKPVVAPVPKNEAPQAAAEDRVAMEQQRQREQMARQLVEVKKQIAECQKAMTSMNEAMANLKEQQPMLQKRMDFQTKVMDVLQQTQTALEAQDFTQAKTLQDQNRTLRMEWSISGETAAQFESEKPTWAVRLAAADATPELKAAWEEYSQVMDTFLSRSKEFQGLQVKRMEARNKLEQLWQAAQKQKEMAAPPNP